MNNLDYIMGDKWKCNVISEVFGCSDDEMIEYEELLDFLPHQQVNDRYEFRCWLDFMVDIGLFDVYRDGDKVYYSRELDNIKSVLLYALLKAL